MTIRVTAILILILMFWGCKGTTKKEEIKESPLKAIKKEPAYAFYVGTYTDGDSQGIYKYIMYDDGSLGQIGLAATSDNPSFLSFSPDRKFLLAVNEIQNDQGVGTLESYAITGDRLSFINRRSSAGAHPCFITTNKDGYVLVANYNGGNVGLLQLDDKGTLSDVLDVQQHAGKGTTDHQEGPHAHSAWFDNGTAIVSVDLGTNALWFSQLDTVHKKLVPSHPNILKMAPGAGPRHLTFHPNKKWAYIINELNATITLIKKNTQGIYETGTSTGTLPNTYTGDNSCADIHISPDGKFVYASNRGHNSIAIFKVDDVTGNLSTLGHESTRGDAPRNFSLSPDGRFLLVANQKTNSIVSFGRNSETGLLTYISKIKAPSPVCILFN